MDNIFVVILKRLLILVLKVLAILSVGTDL